LSAIDLFLDCAAIFLCGALSFCLQAFFFLYLMFVPSLDE